ncbi:AfsR/SARP family transcriptional regulator [Actinoalloteichus caeruleus]|uniref:AfsR/SARP family transcriptional regulator n=1 Tax=Actinoalloteichus cyanogriseus TaxID=2893586 RepID=UPI003BB935EA
MRVAMLGTLEVRTGDGGVAEIGGRLLRVLLVRLALDVGRSVPVDTLLTDLWAGDPPAGGANAVQTLVARLRRSLRPHGAAEAIRSGGGGYWLDLDPSDVDIPRAERLAARGRSAARAGETAGAARSLTEALSCWRGRPLADLPPLPFVEEARHQLVESHLTLTEDWAEARSALGDFAEVVRGLEPLVREWPLRERLAGALIEALAAVGRLADALATYDRLRRALAEELGVDPSPALRGLHLRLLRSDRPSSETEREVSSAAGTRPELPPARRSRGGPRVPVTSFVGREAEFEVALELLDRSRLVTLVGPGGAGKTRMATELVGAIGTPAPSSGPDDQGDPGEAVFVELAPVGDPAELVDALVNALDVRKTALMPAQAGWRQPIVELVDVLASRPSLLVLDNCEHLVDAVAPLVADLLARCPRLRVLATSREALVVPGEALCQIGSLGVPDDRADDAEIRQSPAVRLFADRAAAVSHGFRLTDENVEAVADVCRRLDGLPLPIELAAARLRSMTLRQLVDRLDDRFRLLAAGARSALPRHRTLRAVVEWSWDLLLPQERVLARRLAVFANSATVESATEICAGEDLPSDDIFYLLTSLVDKSLVDIVDDHAGRGRYRMLETVRAYAAERLRDAGEDGRLRATHARYHLRLAQWADRLLRGQDQLTAIAAVHAEHDNLHAALRWAVETCEADLALEFGIALGWYWWLFANEPEAAARIAEILRVADEADVEGTATDPAARAALRAMHAVLRATFAEAVGPDWGELHRACRETEAMLRYPVLTMIEPVLALYAGRPEAAHASLARASASPDAWARAITQLNRLLLLEIEGRFEDIRAAGDEVVRALTAVGDRWGTSRALFTQLVQQSLEGDHEAVLRTGERILALVTELGAEPDIVHVRVCMAQEKIRAGRLDEGEREVREQLAASLRAGRSSLEAGARCLLAQVHRHRGHHVQAREELARARSRLRVQRHELSQQFVGLVMLEEALLALGEGSPGAARASADEVLARFTRPYERPMISVAAEIHAEVALRTGDPAGAARLLGVSHALRGTLDEGNPDLRRVREGVRAALGDDEWHHHFWSTASLGQAKAEEVLRAGRSGSLPDAPGLG